MAVLSGLGSAFGFGNPQGTYYQGGQVDTRGATALNNQLQAYQDPSVTNAGNALENGASMQAALANSGNALSADDRSALATSPIYSTDVATNQAMNDPMLSGLIGNGGQLQQTENALTQEANTGFSLQPEDYTAYGQAAGNIGRQFGQQGQALDQSLASRGMASAGNGASGAEFSTLQGNKNEQLGQLQTQIAQNRMQFNQKQMQQNQQFASQLGGLGANEEQNIANRNMSGAQNQANMASNLSNLDLSDFQAQQNVNQASTNSQIANQKQNVFDAAGSGMVSASNSLASGTAMSRVMGGAQGQNTNSTTVGQNTGQGPTSAGAASMNSSYGGYGGSMPSMSSFAGAAS